jgi:hypothetical protein
MPKNVSNLEAPETAKVFRSDPNSSTSVRSHTSGKQFSKGITESAALRATSTSGMLTSTGT